ncbi:MAG TPA: hypothetical protein DCF68_11075 [Cyanothece sp. UBA12306]|nr:hypothetical protein [Cyanothece sp. UBA12306]
MKKLALGLLTATGLMAAMAPAQAAIFTFALENATYAGGGTLNGTFQFDTIAGEFLSTGYNIITNPTALNQSSFAGNWSDGTSDVNDTISGTERLFLEALGASLPSGGSQNLDLRFDTDISSLALNGTANLVVNANPILGSNESFFDTGVSQSAAVSGGLIRLVNDGTIKVPEPASVIGLLAFGALGAGSAANRKAKQKIEK